MQLTLNQGVESVTSRLELAKENPGIRIEKMHRQELAGLGESSGSSVWDVWRERMLAAGPGKKRRSALCNP